MKNDLILLLLPVALLLACGCSSVTITKPLSAKPEAVDKEKFEGVWLVGDGTVHVKFDDKGVAHIAALEWDDGEFQIGKGEAVVTKGKEHRFISIRIQEEGKWEGYYFCPYRFTDDGDLIIWAPVPESFKKAVESGKLKGAIEADEHNDDVVITDEPEKLLKMIDGPDVLKFFDYTKPLVLKRVVSDD